MALISRDVSNQLKEFNRAELPQPGQGVFRVDTRVAPSLECDASEAEQFPFDWQPVIDRRTAVASRRHFERADPNVFAVDQPLRHEFGLGRRRWIPIRPMIETTRS